MPAPIKIVPGKRYGRLTIEKEVLGRARRTVLCRCDCSRMKEVALGRLRSGNTTSCGCLRSEMVAEKNKTHNLSHLPEYRHWKSMRGRCNNPTDRKYPEYGGRGISICHRWDDFEKFYEDMGPRPSPKHSLDRFPDRRGNYELGNVRWATAEQQSRNRDFVEVIEHDGEEVQLVELAERHGMPACTLRWRLRKGWNMEDALATPSKRGNNQCVKRKR